MKDRKEQRRKRRNLAAAHSQNKPKVHRPKTVYKRVQGKPELTYEEER